MRLLGVLLLACVMGRQEVTVRCPWDLTLNGRVEISDLSILLVSWGAPLGDGEPPVSVAQLAELLLSWGLCAGRCDATHPCEAPDPGVSCSPAHVVETLCVPAPPSAVQDSEHVCFSRCVAAPCSSDSECSADPDFGAVCSDDVGRPASTQVGVACVAGQCEMRCSPCQQDSDCASFHVAEPETMVARCVSRNCVVTFPPPPTFAPTPSIDPALCSPQRCALTEPNHFAWCSSDALPHCEGNTCVSECGAPSCSSRLDCPIVASFDYCPGELTTYACSSEGKCVGVCQSDYCANYEEHEPCPRGFSYVPAPGFFQVPHACLCKDNGGPECDTAADCASHPPPSATDFSLSDLQCSFSWRCEEQQCVQRCDLEPCASIVCPEGLLPVPSGETCSCQRLVWHRTCDALNRITHGAGANFCPEDTIFEGDPCPRYGEYCAGVQGSWMVCIVKEELTGLAGFGCPLIRRRQE